MDIFLLILGFVLTILGIIGSFLPVLPGPLSGWAGLLILHLTDAIPMNFLLLGITLIVAIIIWTLDYIIPIVGTKKFGGSKKGIYGTLIGIVIGLFSPIPFGILFGAFFGALIGELIHDNNNLYRAFKASFGAIIGLLASVTIKFIVSFTYVILFLIKLWEHKTVLF
ncbi:MAG: Uncharacterised protein [Polaribacter sp. SA4-10]|nr:MAG: Uncharacterised protein [Polaribacter sp. SA4-10]|tara:strand:- start:954 stop:1454 length:501 start_codon:yes stop_codon:yes gene_type:complete